MVSRNIDTRMTYVIGISLLLGLSKDVYRDYFAALPAVLQPVASSMLSLTLIVAVALNFVFRIGVRRRETFVFENQQLRTRDRRLRFGHAVEFTFDRRRALDGESNPLDPLRGLPRESWSRSGRPQGVMFQRQ